MLRASNLGMQILYRVTMDAKNGASLEGTTISTPHCLPAQHRYVSHVNYLLSCQLSKLIYPYHCQQEFVFLNNFQVLGTSTRPPASAPHGDGTMSSSDGLHLGANIKYEVTWNKSRWMLECLEGAIPQPTHFEPKFPCQKTFLCRLRQTRAPNSGFERFEALDLTPWCHDVKSIAHFLFVV